MRMPPPVVLSGEPAERNYTGEQFRSGSLTTITLWHDPICPWCWVGFFHARRLTEELGVTFDWRGAELIPPGMEFTFSPPKPVDPNAPPAPPSRFDRFLQAEGIPLKSPRPPFVRSHAALLGMEFARTQGSEQHLAFIEGVYRAYWEQHQDIADPTVLAVLGKVAGLDADALIDSIRAEQFVDNILPFDDMAYAFGIRHVPTFIFGAEEQLAEAHYIELKYATERFLVRSQKFLAAQQAGNP